MLASVFALRCWSDKLRESRKTISGVTVPALNQIVVVYMYYDVVCICRISCVMLVFYAARSVSPVCPNSVVYTG